MALISLHRAATRPSTTIGASVYALSLASCGARLTDRAHCKKHSTALYFFLQTQQTQEQRVYDMHVCSLETLFMMPLPGSFNLLRGVHRGRPSLYLPQQVDHLLQACSWLVH